MKNKLSQDQINTILKAFDEAINTGPWEESTFLRAIGKNLIAMRDKLKAKIGKESADQTTQSELLANRMALRSAQTEIFIALYCTTGSQMQSWERIIANLPNQVISRPIYAQESEVQAIIRSKPNPVNDAYVCIYINPQDILAVAAEKLIKDKLDQPLLTLKDKAIQLKNIKYFVHLSGMYEFSGGRLIKKSQEE